jgi:hypothetical protein
MRSLPVHLALLPDQLLDHPQIPNLPATQPRQLHPVG